MCESKILVITLRTFVDPTDNLPLPNINYLAPEASVTNQSHPVSAFLFLAAAAPPPAMGGGMGGGGGMMGGLMGSLVTGAAMGTGSAIAHRAVDSFMGPRETTVVHQNAPEAAPQAYPQQQVRYRYAGAGRRKGWPITWRSLFGIIQRHYSGALFRPLACDCEPGHTSDPCTPCSSTSRCPPP